MAVPVNAYYRRRFGCKVYKLSLDGGFTCPNRDGTLGTGGCLFCSPYGGGEFAQGQCESIAQQLEKAKARVEAKNPGGKYIAYFQAFTSTYGSLPRLEQLYRAAIAPQDIVGLAIGTRPDCLGDDVIDLLRQIHAVKPVSVELGLQTAFDATARYIRRGYDTAVYLDAVKRLKNAGLEVVTHIILGLPGETPEMAAQTTRTAVEAGTDGVKFHLLHVLRDTDLAAEYEKGTFRCLSLEEYAAALDLCLAQLKPDTVVHRITGDGHKRDLIAPLWSADKKRVLNYLHRNLKHL
jgi:radical SAM protein (TIGR01212 family)